MIAEKMATFVKGQLLPTSVKSKDSLFVSSFENRPKLCGR